MKRTLLVKIAAGVLAATATAVASGRSPFVLPTTASVINYRLHEDENGPSGERQQDQQVSLAVKGDGYGAVVSSLGHPDTMLSLMLDDGKLTASSPATPDAGQPPDAGQSTVEVLGFLVSLAHHQGPIVAGQTWNTTTTADLPGGNMTPVALSVTATSVRGDDVTLAATGNGGGVMHAKGHSAKATIDLVLQASFHEGHVVTATTTRKVTAHVPFRTITFTDMWSIAP